MEQRLNETEVHESAADGTWPVSWAARLQTDELIYL